VCEYNQWNKETGAKEYSVEQSSGSGGGKEIETSTTECDSTNLLVQILVFYH